MRSRPNARVVVRWLPLDAARPGRWPDLLGLLDAAERARAARFRFRPDHDAFVAAHGLLRLMLSAWDGRPPVAWRFRPGPFGKPEIEDRTAGLRFSLSRARGMVAAAVTAGGNLGVDLEALEAGVDRKAAADLQHAFAPDEAALLAACSPATRHKAVLALWTLKESYLKATGTGLHRAPSTVFFSLGPIVARFAPGHGDDPRGWHFRQWCPSPHHVLSLAVRCAPGETPAIDARAAERG